MTAEEGNPHTLQYKSASIIQTFYSLSLPTLFSDPSYECPSVTKAKRAAAQEGISLFEVPCLQSVKDTPPRRTKTKTKLAC